MLVEVTVLVAVTGNGRGDSAGDNDSGGGDNGAGSSINGDGDIGGDGVCQQEESRMLR